MPTGIVQNPLERKIENNIQPGLYAGLLGMNVDVWAYHTMPMLGTYMDNRSLSLSPPSVLLCSGIHIKPVVVQASALGLGCADHTSPWATRRSQLSGVRKTPEVAAMTRFTVEG